MSVPIQYQYDKNMFLIRAFVRSFISVHGRPLPGPMAPAMISNTNLVGGLRFYWESLICGFG